MIIQSRNVYYEEKLQPRQIVIDGDKIVNILPYGMCPCDRDYGDNVIMPGLIDIHNHGYNRGDSNHATIEWLKEWMAYLPSEGVTATLATTSSAPYEDIINSLHHIAEFMSGRSNGAQLLGVYSEGPFISKAFPGAQSLTNQIIPTPEVIDSFIEASGNRLIYVMIAPDELEGNYDVISYCVKKGIKVTLGHTGADFKTCEAAVRAGAVSFTHTYNGMKGLHHREPGTLGAAMYYDDCYAELICDGVHTHPVAANILARIKGKDRLILITDSVAIKGLKPGFYHTPDRDVTVGEDGVGRLANGTIAGSCNRLNKVLRFAIKEAKIDLITAYNACTINPCRLLNVNQKGLIKEGYDADIVVFDPEYEPIDVYIMGEKF